MRPPVHMLRGKFPFLDDRSVGDVRWAEFEPRAPAYRFEPDDSPIDFEYERHVEPSAIFAETCVGFQSHRDDFVLSASADSLRDRIARFADPNLPIQDICTEFRLKDNRDWKAAEARRLLGVGDWSDTITACAWRPFVQRHAALNDIVMDYPRELLIGSMKGRRNLALCLPKAVPDNRFCHAQMADLPVHDCYSSTKSGEAVHVFPAWIYEDGQGDLLRGRERVSNLKPAFAARLAALLGVPAIVERESSDRNSFDPVDVQSYCYAVYASKEYALRYSAQFKKGFARVPFPTTAALFWTLSELGRRLTALHLLRETAPTTARFPEPGSNEIGKIKVEPEGPATKRIWINRTQCFTGVLDMVWEHTVGAFQVLPKWLEWHKEPDASFDPHEFLRVAGAIEATFPIVAKIDEAIRSATPGLWRGAAA